MKKILLCAFLLLVQSGFAQIPKAQKNTYINDFAHVLTTDQVYTLNKEIYRIEKASTVQIAIVLVKTVPPKYDIAKFAVLIGRKWGVGKAHNGIVYVAAIDQHKQHIELDSAALNKLPATERESVLDAIKPYFRQGDYNGGITDLVSKLNQYFVPPAVEPAKSAAEKPVAAKVAAPESETPPLYPILIVCGIMTLSVFLLIRWIIKAISRAFNRGRSTVDEVYQSDGGYSGYPRRHGWLFNRLFYRRHRYGHDTYYNTYNNYNNSSPASFTESSQSNNDDEDNRPSSWGIWGSSSSDDDDSDDDNRRDNGSSSSSSSSGGGFSSSGGSTSSW